MKTPNKLRVCLLGLCALVGILWVIDIWKSADRQPISLRNKESTLIREVTKEQAMDLVSKIHENMTFAEISKIIPLSTNDNPRLLTKGGIWYDVWLGKHVIQLRFQYPGKSYATTMSSSESLLNLAPILQSTGSPLEQ
jgi:hypothetical protein